MLTIGSSLYSRYLYNIKFLKLYLLFLTTSKSFNHGGDSIYNILKHSNVIVRILLICRDGTFDNWVVSFSYSHYICLRWLLIYFLFILSKFKR